MHTRASIGIVIPALNAGQFLGATLQSVLMQTLGDWELVVVDDGSSDGTVGLVQQFALNDKRFRLIRQRNGGTARARNAGLAALSHKVEYVAFLDHDDVWVPHALSILREALEANPNAPAAHGLARKIDVEGRPLGEGPAAIQNYDRMTMRSGRVVTVDRAAPTTAAMVIYDNLICTPGAALIRRTALREIGDPIFNPTVTPLDDWDVWLRLAMQGDLAYIDRLVLDWRRHGAAGLYDAEAIRSAEMRIRQRLMESNLPEDQKAIADARYDLRRADACYQDGRVALERGQTGVAREKLAEAVRRNPKVLGHHTRLWRARIAGLLRKSEPEAL